METIVLKFGGSSLADAAQIRKAADIIRSDPARRYVVCSAPGKRSGNDVKVTDLLYQCQDAARSGGDFAAPLAQIEQRFQEIVQELGVDFDLAAEIAIISRELNAGVSRAYLASRGEYLNSKLIAAYLGFPFVDAADCVCFDAEGTLDAEETNRRLYAALNPLQNAVLPGFYGSGPEGEIVTFSRGGSDVTGALVARAVMASLYENWTDVSGMLAADPRIVPNPRQIDYISYQELRELSYMGFSVFHETRSSPARRPGFPSTSATPTAPPTPAL